MTIVPTDAVSGICLSILLKVHIGKPSSASVLCNSFGINTNVLQDNRKSTRARCAINSLKAVILCLAINFRTVTSIIQPFPIRLRRNVIKYMMIRAFAKFERGISSHSQLS